MKESYHKGSVVTVKNDRVEVQRKAMLCHGHNSVKEKHYIEATKGRNAGSLNHFELNDRTNFGIIEVNSVGWQSFNDAEKAK